MKKKAMATKKAATWTTKDGTVVKVANMEAGHLLNAIAMCERVARRLGCLFNGNAESFSAGQMYHAYPGLVDEAVKRGLVKRPATTSLTSVRNVVSGHHRFAVAGAADFGFGDSFDEMDEN